MSSNGIWKCALAALVAAGVAGCQHMGGGPVDLGYPPGAGLSSEEVKKILDQAEESAKKTGSLLRVDLNGKQVMTRMHIIIVDRTGVEIGRRSMPDAWAGSVSIAHAKAFTAMAFSSDDNALTTRTLGPLTQPGGPLWNIGNSNRAHGLIEFPGGVPLYKGGHLVGGVGVSGDGVDQDEVVAVAGAKGFEPPAAIRIDSVLKAMNVPYTK
jgi:uncharacterized protein GlcG (DUF336 family)